MSDASPREHAIVEKRFGYRFRDRTLLKGALTHASLLPAGAVRAAERLELLGDAVLDLAVADLLMQAFPAWNEGQLSKRRAHIVQTETLARKAGEIGLGAALKLGRGEERSGGRDKASILAATYEAVLGAVFRDAGYEAARSVVAGHFQEELSARALRDSGDWKTLLQERTQALWRIVPEYRLIGEAGPPHARRFTCEVWIAERRYARGRGRSKRTAEQQAARSTLEELERTGEPR